MYSIEYYKSKREKPVLEEPTIYGDEKFDFLLRKRYLYQKDLIDKCWNIKSLTIDLEDIYNIIHDKNSNHLMSLYTRVKRANIDDNVKTITILNNNDINLSYIYEIINCNWMINRDEMIVVLKVSRQLCDLIKEYDKTTNINKKRDIEILINYYMDTIMNKSNSDNQTNDDKTLKLGKYFID